jgi:hypothetical protein
MSKRAFSVFCSFVRWFQAVQGRVKANLGGKKNEKMNWLEDTAPSPHAQHRCRSLKGRKKISCLCSRRELPRARAKLRQQSGAFLPSPSFHFPPLDLFLVEFAAWQPIINPNPANFISLESFIWSTKEGACPTPVPVPPCPV